MYTNESLGNNINNLVDFPIFPLDANEIDRLLEAPASMNDCVIKLFACKTGTKLKACNGV